MIYWRVAIWKGAAGPLITALAATPTIILNWDTMTPQGRTVAIVGFGITWYKAFDLFIDQTMSRLAAGKPPIPIDGNGHSSTTTTTTTTTTPPSQPSNPVQS